MATSLTVDVESGRATLTMDVEEEDFSGSFEALEGDTDGQVFDFNGIFSTTNGEEFPAMVHFMKNGENLEEFFLMIQ
jgi:hypothetical protein